ncbi:MAG: carbohydrate ABC transporter permease [Lachnospiraceae bacterium]|nr:carbohydrate ABC transporter permease [Lachnospiraceae bacterium]
MNMKSERGFSNGAAVIMMLLAFICIFPVLLLFMSSITSEASLLKNGYSVFPEEFGFDAYRYLWMSREKILRAYGMTIAQTSVGTSLSVVVTTLLAYPLSRKDLPGRNVIAFYIFFTMLFSGGMIPSYMMWTQMFHIKDTFFALIFPSLFLSGFAVIMMRTYFSTNIPDNVLEAAKIDGASEVKILLRIVLPMSKPILSTVGLMTALAYWNDWMNGLYYLTKRTDLYTIQNLLNRLITSADFLSNNQANSLLAANIQVPSVGVRMAVAVIAILPILVIYPFFQKGFVKGIVIGGVKG